MGMKLRKAVLALPLVFTVFIGLIACSNQNLNPAEWNANSAESNHITGGEPVTESDYAAASTVSLYITEGRDFYSFCTGTLIAPDLVLTAGHCVADAAKDFHMSLAVFQEQVSIGFGLQVAQSLQDPNVTFRKIKSLAVHPDYKINSFKYAEKVPMYDVTLIRLSSAAPKSAKPALLLTDASELVQGKEILLAGFGFVDGHAQIDATQMMQATVTIDNPQLTVAQFTYKVFQRRSSCNGDSGGPAYLIDRDNKVRLAGVTSWGDAYCVSMGAYTSVPAVAAWIQSAELSL